MAADLHLVAHHHATPVGQPTRLELHVAMLGLQMAQGVVQVLGDGQRQLASLGAHHPALVLAEAVEGGLHRVADDLALVVRQVPGHQQQVLLALQQAALVIDIGDPQLQVAGIHGAALVVELAGTAEDQLRGVQGPVVVVDAGGLEVQPRGGLELAAGVEQILLEFQVQSALLGADQAVMAVVQALAGHRDLVGEQLATLVEYFAARGLEQGLGLEPAGIVVELLGNDEGRCGLAGTDQALPVIQPVGADVQRVGDHRALLVAHLAGLDGQPRGGHLQAPAIVVQAIERQVHGLPVAEADQAAQVGDGRGIEHQFALGQQPRLFTLVENSCSVDPHLGPLDHPALVVQDLACREVEIATGQDIATVLQVAGDQLDLAVVVAAVVGIDPGLDDAVVDHLRSVHHLDPVTGRQAGAYLDLLAGLQGRLGTGIGLALEIDVPGLHGDGLVGADTRYRDLAIGVDLDIAGAGGHVPGHVHPHAPFGTHQADGPGIHPTQRRAVDGQLRLGLGLAVAGRDAQVVGLDVVAPGDDVELLGVEVGIELGAAGDQVELVDIAGIEPGALDADIATLDLEPVEPLAFDHRLAGGQGRPRGIDEAATVAGDAMGVGDDDPGGLPGHLGVAGQLAAVAAGDFVEDDLRRLALEVGVAEDVATQLGALGRIGGVVEDQAVTADVVFAELVMGQAAAIGPVDIDDGHAVTRRADGRIATGRRVQGQLGGDADDRVEEQDPRQRQGNALGKRLAYVHVQIIHPLTVEQSQKNRSTRKYTGCSRLSIIAGRSRERAKLSDAARYWPRALSSMALPLRRPLASRLQRSPLIAPTS